MRQVLHLRTTSWQWEGCCPTKEEQKGQKRKEEKEKEWLENERGGDGEKKGVSKGEQENKGKQGPAKAKMGAKEPASQGKMAKNSKGCDTVIFKPSGSSQGLQCWQEIISPVQHSTAVHFPFTNRLENFSGSQCP